MTTVLGMSKEQWEIANAIATCVGVVATFAAVIVSLWLARRTDRLELSGIAGVRVIMTPGLPGKDELLMLQVTNRGRRVAKITHIGWEIGRFRRKRRHFVQRVDGNDGLSSSMPVVLDDGEEARWYHPLGPWLERVDDFADKRGRANFRYLYFVFGTSVGGTHRVRVEPNLGSRLEAALLEVAKSVSNDSGRPTDPMR